MKISRSAKCSLKFATAAKRQQLATVLEEYGRVVNVFIDRFWESCPRTGELLKPVVDSVESWFSARLRKVAAREAIAMVLAVKKRREAGKKVGKPRHAGRSMSVSCTIAELLPAKRASEFDAWLYLQSIGNGIKIQMPIRYHKHFKGLAARGSRNNFYIISLSSVQFSFEIDTGSKLKPTKCLGIDSGIKALASTSTGEQFGLDIEAGINRINRCKKGSKGKLRAIRALHQRMDEVAKQIVTGGPTLIVVENLKGITKNTKRRLVKSMRRTIGHWNIRYWLTTLERKCEDNRVGFRSVSARYTSQTCNQCSHVDRGNRRGELFRCLSCGHQANADINAARNILERFTSGPYGAGCKTMRAKIA